jgi:hypothetical protein
LNDATQESKIDDTKGKTEEKKETVVAKMKSNEEAGGGDERANDGPSGPVKANNVKSGAASNLSKRSASKMLEPEKNTKMQNLIAYEDVRVKLLNIGKERKIDFAASGNLYCFLHSRICHHTYKMNQNSMLVFLLLF